MRTISQFLNLAKTKNDITSDRRLAVALKLTSVAAYRKRHTIPDDITAIRLADLCGLPRVEVVLTCQIHRSSHPEIKAVWTNVLTKQMERLK